MTKNINKLIEIAYAAKPAKQQFRQFHVCGIFRKNKLISLAFNQKKTHTFALKMGYPFPEKGQHAELSTILRAGLEDFSGHELIVLRVDNNGKLANSRPCEHCTRVLHYCRFPVVIYSTDVGFSQL